MDRQIRRGLEPRANVGFPRWDEANSGDTWGRLKRCGTVTRTCFGATEAEKSRTESSQARLPIRLGRVGANVVKTPKVESRLKKLTSAHARLDSARLDGIKST
jgi:hypothetical protein